MINRRDFIARSVTAPVAASAPSQVQLRQPDHAAMLAQHDIVYLTPASVRADFLPVGNGDLTGLVTMPPRGLDITVNKSNLFDDRPIEPPQPPNWAWDIQEEERWTALVHGARLAIRSPLPVLDPLYLDDFEARLNLHEAQVRVASASPLGKIAASVWVSTKPAVLVVDYEETTAEPVEREIELERYGSRRLFHWYSQYDPKQTGAGLDGTEAGADREHVWIVQKLRAVSFAVVARFTGSSYRTAVRSLHSAVVTTAKSQRLTGQLYLSIVTSEEDPDPLEAARRNVDAAVAQGRDTLLAAHRKHWAGFWSKSYIHLPNDHLENLWYFTLYSLAASSQGAYPPTHCGGGGWFWNRDIRRWGHYYHWDVQQQYWPVHSSNHPELARPYYDFRYKTLPEARKYAREVHQRGGAFYSDVTDRTGRGTIHGHVSYILTAGPQIAMDFWRHYLYTEDREFLLARAYPVMKATAQFYLEYVERDADGKYHIPKSTGYENPLPQRDTITDLATIRQHFPACIRASEILGVDRDLRARWADVVRNLAGFAIMDNAVDENGKKLPRVFTSGIPLVDGEAGPDPHYFMATKRAVKKGERQFNISFFCETAPVFPSGVIGLGQRGTELYDVAVNTAMALARGPAWNSVPTVALARLGRGDEALRLLGDIVERYRRSPQGFFAEGTEPHEWSGNRFDMSRPFRLIDGKRTTERSMLPGGWFDFPDYELGGVFMTALNEMLLQSHDGVIRIFPAMPGEWGDATFRLRAVGAFLVTAEMRGGEVRPCVIESLAGTECRIEPPWPQASVKNLETGRILGHGSRPEILPFQTTKGSRYLVFRTGGPEAMPEPPAATGGPNKAPKQWRGRRIGIPRQF